MSTTDITLTNEETCTILEALHAKRAQWMVRADDAANAGDVVTHADATQEAERFHTIAYRLAGARYTQSIGVVR